MTQPEQQHAGDALVPLEVDWSAADALPVLLVNQVVAQIGPASDRGTPDGAYIALGHVAPPILLGSPDEMRRSLERLGGRLNVSVHGRYFLTTDQLQQLIRVLQETADKLNKAGENR